MSTPEVETAKKTARDTLRLVKSTPAHDAVDLATVAATTAKVIAIDTPRAWRKKLTRENGKPACNQANAVNWVVNCPAIKDAIWFDEFAGKQVVRGEIGTDPDKAGAPGPDRLLTDEHYTAAHKLAQDSDLKRVARESIINAMQLHARESRRFNPVKDYLESVKRHPGQSLLNHMFLIYFGARGQKGDGAPMTLEECQYLADVGRFSMVSAVARIYNPGCKVDTMPILEGPQGLLKSQALDILFSPWFSDSMPHDFACKDAMQHLQGNWCLELSELPQLKKSEVETVKNFLSRREDKYRPAYGRETREFKRQCVFIGSTNDEHYLKDTTGNRRFWPVLCGRVNLKLLQMHRDRLWAEAVHRYKAGEHWWFEGDAQQFAATAANNRVAPDPWQVDVVHALEHSIADEEFSPGEVLKAMGVDLVQRTSMTAGRVAVILRGLGCRKTRRHMTRGQLYRRAEGIARPTDKIGVQS